MPSGPPCCLLCAGLGTSHGDLHEILAEIIAELLCGRRPQKWSPIPILRGMLVIFYGHGKRNGSRARAPYIHTYIHTYVRTSHFMTFLHEVIFPGRAETKEKRRR